MSQGQLEQRVVGWPTSFTGALDPTSTEVHAPGLAPMDEGVVQFPGGEKGGRRDRERGVEDRRSDHTDDTGRQVCFSGEESVQSWCVFDGGRRRPVLVSWDYGASRWY